ncbi:MAG: metal-sensitive transcriptional regulator [Aurantimicrobium sp.]|jgi:DNA-binding FrmR family transcriptional regulator|nr:metal-sensitive transcriptional regulator [Aurantimicrobium sp.]
MKLPADELKNARNRLVRVQGQIGGLVRMIDEGRDCTEILTQLAAASTALDRAGFSIIATGMSHCGTGPEGDVNRVALEKAFMSMA